MSRIGKRSKRALIVALSIVIAIVLAFLIYVSSYYKATCNVQDTSLVEVTRIKEGYFFDGPGTESAFVFYPGGKVEDIAYAELLSMVAEQGVDCFLVHMPFNLAFFGYNKASSVVNSYSYDNWYIGGHSLGGVFASYYAAENSVIFNGVVFLASYSSKDLNGTGLSALSIVGTEDAVLNREAYEKARGNFPQVFVEVELEGANHCQFGSYGFQKGDGEASISGFEQKEITARSIVSFVLEN